MSDTFDPGPGWEEIQADPDEGVPVGTLSWIGWDGNVTYWVQEKPKKPLPTKSGYVIHIEDGKDAGFWMRSDQGWWLKWGSDEPMRRTLEYTEYTIKTMPFSENETSGDEEDSITRRIREARTKGIQTALSKVREKLGPGPRGKEGYLSQIAKDLGVD